MDKKVLDEYRKSLRKFSKMVSKGDSNAAYAYLKDKADELGIDIEKYPFCNNKEIKNNKVK